MSDPTERKSSTRSRTRSGALPSATAVLIEVLGEWVNGRRVADGISQTVLRRAKAVIEGPMPQEVAEELGLLTADDLLQQAVTLLECGRDFWAYDRAALDLSLKINEYLKREPA